MAKGMSMEEFRESLASEARNENVKLKEELDKLKKTFSDYQKEKEKEIETLQNYVKSLQNRCYVTSRGALCAHCGIEGCKYGFTPEDEIVAIEYMTKNKLPMNNETYTKLEEIMNKRRQERIKNIFKKETVKENNKNE